MAKSAEQNILDYLKTTRGPIAGSELQRMIFKNKSGTAASPKTIARRLAENAEIREGFPAPVLIATYNQKGHVHYEYDRKQLPKKMVPVQLPNGNVRLEYHDA